MKNFSIELNGKKFDYQIKKLKAWDWSNLLTELLQTVTSTDQFSAKNIIAALHAITQTGVDVNNVKPTDVANVLKYAQSNTFTFLYDMIRSAINNLDETRREKIFTLALSCVQFNNGLPEAGGMMIPLNLDNIDMYILSPMDLMLIIKEALMYNYMPVIESFFLKAPNTP